MEGLSSFLGKSPEELDLDNLVMAESEFHAIREEEKRLSEGTDLTGLYYVREAKEKTHEKISRLRERLGLPPIDAFGYEVKDEV